MSCQKGLLKCLTPITNCVCWSFSWLYVDLMIDSLLQNYLECDVCCFNLFCTSLSLIICSDVQLYHLLDKFFETALIFCLTVRIY